MKLLSVTLLLLLIILQYQLWLDKDGYQEGLVLKKLFKHQQTENAELVARNARLSAEVQDLKHGLSAIEALARHDLGMIREGEVFYQIIE